ncbi:MAG: serine hydrolase [Planctomycetota bacterium]
MTHGARSLRAAAGAAFVPLAALLPALPTGLGAQAPPADEAAARAARQQLCRQLEDVVARERADKQLPAVFVALLDVDPRTGEEWSWAIARGDAAPAGHTTPAVPAAVDSVLRTASLSKPVTATCALLLQQRGAVDLDAPVRRWLPRFLPDEPRAAAITLRMLLQHRSGLSRECPVGHWLDTSSPSLEATVRSLDDTALLFDPDTATSYSSPGYAVVGRVLEVATGQPFEQLAEQLVLGPLGMNDSSFAARPDLLARTARGAMWTRDGRAIPLPTHQFGYGPAANLRSTTGDLLRLARSWFAGATASPLDAASLQAMHTADANGTGLGCYVGDFDGARRIGHSGTAPGTAVELATLPDEGLAVVVAITLDFTNDVAESIAARALRGMRALRRGEPMPPLPPWPVPVGADEALQLAGRYGAGDEWFDLLARGPDLVFDPCIGVASVQRRQGDRWTDDDRLVVGRRVLHPVGSERVNDGFSDFERWPAAAPPPPAPAALLPLLGDYGFDHGGLCVYEDGGRLGVLLGWHVRELPEPAGPDRYVFLPGAYGGEELRFVRDAKGRVTHAVCCNMTLPRRPDPDPRGFRIRAQRAVAELRQLARQARPPEQPSDLLPSDLVPLAPLSPTLQYDIRYATADNFLGEPVYERAAPMLQRPAAAALLAAHERLRPLGYGLLVHDAYRPWSVTKVFWDATPAELRHFVADPARGSRHNRGCAVDLTLYDLATGAPVEMPSGYDEFTERAYPDWPGGTERQRFFRELLRRTMSACGFTVYEHEWWHFDFRGWERYPVLDQPLR